MGLQRHGKSVLYEMIWNIFPSNVSLRNQFSVPSYGRILNHIIFVLRLAAL